MTADQNGETLDGASPAMNEAQASLTVARAVELAMRIHGAGDFAVAETLYRRILDAEPDCADALHYLGVLHHQTDRSDDAVALIRRAIALRPDHAASHNNLGNVLTERNRPDEAADAYRAAIALDPTDAGALNNLGVALRTLGRLDDAEASYRNAIAADPTHREAYDNLGHLMASLDRIDEAILCHLKALELEPRSPDTRRWLVAAYIAIGDLDRATGVLDQWVEDEPDDATARHYRASVSGRDVPERASDAHVETMFDRFAASFDAKLTSLKYRAPDLVAAAVRDACGEPKRDRVVLDAGCGTGLCGPLLAPFAAVLHGVDLSAKMLEKAAGRTCYDALSRAELTQYIRDHPAAYDLIVSADTLCYFGALDAVVAAAAGALRPGGALVFSVEEEAGPTGVRLNPHGRYSHSVEHVSGALAAAGLSEPTIVHDVLRRERGQPVAGLIVTARKG